MSILRILFEKWIIRCISEPMGIFPSINLEIISYVSFANKKDLKLESIRRDLVM